MTILKFLIVYWKLPVVEQFYQLHLTIPPCPYNMSKAEEYISRNVCANYT